jgi:disulfide bond formation protein DsbB
MNNIKRETILKLVLIFSIIAILSAYFIQYVLGHQPCNLCLIERIPYISSIIIISAILIFKNIYECIYHIPLSFWNRTGIY